MSSAGDEAAEPTVVAPRRVKPRVTLASLNADVAGGFAATLISLPQSLSLGVLVYAALGPGYASAGVVAALIACVAGNLIGAATYAVRCQILGPRASTTTIVAALVAALVAHPGLQGANGPDGARILAFVFVAVALSGVFQMVFGLAGLGRPIKYVPYPVVAGFMNGIAVVLLASQARPLLGLEVASPQTLSYSAFEAIRLGSVATGIVTLAAVYLAPRWTRRIPAMLCGLLAGIATHYTLAWVFPGSTGAVVGELPDILPHAGELRYMAEALLHPDAMAMVQLVLPTALLLAVVASLDGLLAAVVSDSVTRGRHDSNRLLVGQGLANITGAAFGAIPVVGNTHTPVANFQAGGRTRLSTLFHAVFVLAAMFALGPLVAKIPLAALAGLMIYLALSLCDRWSRDLVLRLASRAGGRMEIATSIGIVILVATAQVVLNVMAALAIGVVAAVALLLVKLSGSPVRRHLDARARSSLKVRGPEARELLRSMAAQIRILELEGELFFGTADRLQSEFEQIPEATRFVILDLRRVHQIDASGARVLEVIAQRAKRHGLRVVLSHVRAGERHGRYLRAHGLEAAIAPEHWFADLDRALEWAEDQLLQRARFEEAEGELPIERMSIFEGLSPEQVARATGRLERLELRGGDTVFNEGDRGDRMYFIARGAVSIKVRLDNEAHARRLATFTAGVMFGEMALLEGDQRSADAFAKGELVVLYSLSAPAFAALVHEDPALGVLIYRNLGRELAARLRATSGALRALE